MTPSLPCFKLKITFIIVFLPLFCHQISTFDVSSKCEEECHSQVNLDQNHFDLACNDSCKLYQCQRGCQRWTSALTSCQQACNDTSKVTGWVFYCVLGCNHALNLYIDKIIAEVGIPAAPYLVADSISNHSLTIEWNPAPARYSNITYLVQWKYENLPGDWNYYQPEMPLTKNRLRIQHLKAYTMYRFRVAWIIMPQLTPLMSNVSVIISTLPYGVPSTSPTITSLIAVSASQISVSWEPPAFPNAPIISYDLSVQEQPNGPRIVKDAIMPNGDSHDSDLNRERKINSGHYLMHYLFNNLKAETEYLVSITARNNFGVGPKDEKNITTLNETKKVEDDVKPQFIIASEKEVLRHIQDVPPSSFFDSEVLFRLSDYTASASISGMAIHVEYKYIFVSDTLGVVRRISLKDENNKQIKSIIKDRSRRPSHLSVDWLNDKLYMIEDNKISRCGLDGDMIESVINGFDNRPIDMKVDPYNGYLYWILDGESVGGLYRVDLAMIKNQFIASDKALLIYKDASLRTFAVDYTNYLIYLPISRESSVFSITIDGNHPTNIRQNSHRTDELDGIENLVMHNELFYFTKNTEIFQEEYNPESKTYHHSATQIDTEIVSLKVMDYQNQPYPYPLNPVKDVQAVFLDKSAKVIWNKPELLAGAGQGSWQKWSYEVSISETLSHVTFLRRGLNHTDCVADELNPGVEYSIKVRGYSKSGNGTWSVGFHGKTLKKIDRFSRFPFALWGTKQGVIKTNLVGDYVEHLVHKMNMNGSIVNDIEWYNDVIFLNANNYVYIYNITSHESLIRLPNITSASSIAIDWVAPKLYWSSSSQQIIMRSYINGSNIEPLPITTFAKEMAIDSMRGYLYWTTTHNVKAARLNGMNILTYYEIGLFSGSYVMGLTLDFDRNLLYWLVRSFDKALLYSAHLADGENINQIKHSVQMIGPMQETNVQGPLVYFNDRLFWLREHNETMISDMKGQNLATLRGTGLLDISSLAIVNPSMHLIPNGFSSLNEVNVIPNSIKPHDIKVIGSWDNFAIKWTAIDNVNYGQVFYNLLVEDSHYSHTLITVNTKYNYPTVSHLNPFSKIKFAIRAFTYWASSKQTIIEIHSPMSTPTSPTYPRVYIYHEKSAYYGTIQKIHAEFRWSPPEVTNGIISGYIVNASSYSYENNKNISELDQRVLGDSNVIYLSDLKINTTYYFQVQALTESGEGPLSQIVSVYSSEENPVPRLLVAKTNSIRLVDVDSQKEKVITMKASYPISVSYIMEEKKVFWIEEDGIIKSSNVDGTNLTVIHQLSLPGTSLAVDWISRTLYFSESDNNFEKSNIWSYDFNSKSNPSIILTKSNVKISTIEVDPFSSSLLWTEMFASGQGILKTCNISSPINCNPRLFFKQNYHKQREFGKNCNCSAHSAVGAAISIDRSKESNPELLWVDAKFNNVIASDMSGCFCRVVINSTYGLPPTSLTADNNYIYWSNASLGNVYSVVKEAQLEKNSSMYLFLLNSSNSPHLIVSEAIYGVNGIRAHGHHLQPYPMIDCLIPMDYQSKAKFLDNTANSLTISISDVQRPYLCQNVTFSSVLYIIYYGKISSDGVHECGVSLRGCKKFESYNDTVTIKGLDSYTNYSIRIAVTNFYMPKDQVVLPGPEIIFETAESRPSPPKNVIVKIETPKRILVTWEPPEKPNGDLILYEVRWYTNKNPHLHNAIHAKKLNTTRFGERYLMKLVELESTTTYCISVRAYSSDGLFYSDSNIVYATTYDLPNDIKLGSRSARSIIVNWLSPPSNNSLSEIAQHTMQYSKIGEQQWHGEKHKLTKPNTSYEFHFNNLTPNTEYAFRLLLTYRSTTTLFEWPGNDEFIFKTLPDAPDPPKKPSVENLGSNVYKVSWSSGNNNGAENIYYKLEVKKVLKDNKIVDIESDDWSEVYNDTVTDWLIDELSTNTNYLFRVQAYSEFGVSNYSLVSDDFYYPNNHPTSENKLMTIFSIVLGVLLFILVSLTLAFSVCKHQVEEKKKKALEDNRIHGNGLELVPWPELPGHPHQTNTLYHNNFDFNDDLIGVPRIHKEQISITKFLGSGAFGEVFEGSWHQSDKDCLKSEKVAIKTLRKGASEQLKMDFIKEAKFMANFKHPNILKLLGICLDTNVNFLILELMEEGDLLKYLRSNRPKGAIPSSLTLYDLLSICVDVAMGCKYLEEIRFVHRDLAARNCLVSCANGQRIVKIGDFGLARDIYKNDYYRKEGEGLLPVRWMAPESLLDGEFTCQSDVWSFGVLLYEVISLGHQPYFGMSNGEVLNHVTSGGKLYDRPQNCPDDLFILMNQCWSYHSKDRPSFAQCLETLEKIQKNLIDSTKVITCVHNQNYSFERGFDNPGYREDEKLNAGNSLTLKNSTNSNCSAQTECTNLTGDSLSSYKNGSSKYLELMNEQDELTDADGYQIPISKFPFQQSACDTNQLLHTITQIVLKPEQPIIKLTPISMARKKFFSSNTLNNNTSSRNFSPPPTYTQIFKGNDLMAIGEELSPNKYQKLKNIFNYDDHDESSQDTKNNLNDLVNDIENDIAKSKVHISSSSSSTLSSASSSSTIPAVAGALLKSSHSSEIISAPSRNMTELQFYFDEKGLPKRAIYSSASHLTDDERSKSNSNSNFQIDQTDDGKDNINKSNNRFTNPHSSQNGFINVNYENSENFNQMKSQSNPKLATINRIGGISSFTTSSNCNLNIDPNTSWC